MAAEFLSSFKKRAILSIIILSLVFPLLTVLLSGNFQYYLNVEFFNQKIFLVASLFLFLSFVVFGDKFAPLGWKPPDFDDAVAFAVVSFSFICLLGFLHVDFDTLLSMEKINAAGSQMSVGAGNFLADSFDLDQIKLGASPITKVIMLGGNPDAPLVLRMYAGWDGGAGLNSSVLLNVNGIDRIDISQQYAQLKSGVPSWIEVSIPQQDLVSGENAFAFTEDGPDYAYLASQWAYHDAKTLNADGSYYGQEALVYLRRPPPISRLFGFAFDYQLAIKAWAIAFLVLAVMGKDAMFSALSRHGAQLLALFVISVVAINGILIIQNEWQRLSLFTGEAAYRLLSPFLNVYKDFSNPAGPVIGVKDFYIRIFESCSGIESLGVFSLLFLALVAFNAKGINMAAVPFLFLAGVAGTLSMNVLRIVLLVLIGAFISPDLAVNAFHTNAGWVLMLAYFAVFTEVSSRLFIGGKGHGG